MIKHQFSDFSYAVNKDSAKKGHKEVLVCFMYNGTEVLKKVYIPEKAGTAYIFEAKQIIDKEMRDGSLAAYAHKFVGRKNKEAAKPKAAPSSSSNKTEYVPLPPKKGLKIAFVIVCVLFVAAAAVAVLFMLKKPAPTIDKVAITFDGNGGSWTTGENIEYSKTITVDKGTKWSEVSKPDTTYLTKDDNSFDCWTINGKKPDDGYVFESANTTVSANYKNDTISLTFSRGANGTWEDGTPDQTKEVPVILGSTFESVKDKVKVEANEDWKFDFFSDGTKNQSPLGDSYKFSKNDKGKIFEAKYYATASSTVTITADANGGTWKEQVGSLYEVEVDKHSTWELTKSKFSEMIEQPTGYTETDPSWEYFNGSSWISLEDNYTFDSNTQIRAIYTPNKLDIMFEASPGTFPSGQSTQHIEVNYNDTFALYSSDDRLVITPPADQYFTYFAYESGGKETPLTDSYVFDGSETSFKAMYRDNSKIYLVIDANGGLIDDQPSILNDDLSVGSTWTEVNNKLNGLISHITEPERKVFNGWEYYDGNSWTDIPESGALAEQVLRIRVVYANEGITVTFSSGEGTWLSGGSEDIVYDQGEVLFEETFGDFKQEYEDDIKVTPPTRKVFLYFTDENNKVVSDDYVLVDGKTYTAQYMQVQSDYVTVTIDPQGGKISDSEAALLLDNVTIGSTWSDIKTAHPEINALVAPTGSQLKEWQYYNGSDWAKLEDTYVFNVNTRVKASYESTKIQQIVFSAGEGTWADGTETVKTKENANYGTTLDELDSELNLTVNPADERHVFTYFSISPDVGDPIVIGPDYVFTKSETVTAQYASITEAVNLTFDAQEGTIHGRDEFYITFPSGITWANIFAACPSIPDDPLKEFDFYSFDDSTVAIPTPIDPTGTCSIEDSGKTIYAYYKDVTTQKFENDSWLNLSKNATGHTLDELLAIYNEADGGEEFTTFVGKTKTIKISDSLSYEVMVIGEDADETADGQTATLTFQFTKLVTGGINYAEEKSDYTTSNLKAYLDDYINYLPADLQQSIVNVKKDTYSHESKAPVTTTGNYLFALSMSEMNKTISPVTGEQIGYSEGNPYAYYTQPGAIYERQYKASTPYWTRSPEVSEASVNYCAYAFDDHGDLISDELDLTVNNAYGVLPAFCIGAHA